MGYLLFITLRSTITYVYFYSKEKPHSSLVKEVGTQMKIQYPPLVDFTEV